SERGRAGLAGEPDVPEGRVARAAEIDGGLGPERRRIEDRRSRAGGRRLLHRLDVLPSGAVAGLARDARHRGRRIERPAGGRAGRMTAETALQLDGVYAARHRLVEIARRVDRAARGEAEAVDRVEVAHARFVERAVAREEKRLADVADPERPRERRRRG